jgi:NADH:ubiquinone oxidoreductase subunit 5 (subunit L)/multisubunit Na+/H+ antiporter MnhA subunit
MRRRILTASCWLVVGALVVLFARSIAYALSPSPLARVLEHKAGGPGLPILTLAALALGGTFAIVICWLAAFGVRERALLERSVAPRFHPLRMVVRAAVLAVCTSLLGGLFEAYLHWRAGLGWHGLHCVLGPLHRDLWPIATALSLIASAVLSACEHVFAWMRRTFASLRAVPPRAAAVPVFAVPAFDLPSARQRPFAGGPRAPPAFS